MFQKKSDTVQYQFADIINKIDKDDPSLLVYYTMDRGYFLALDQVPSMKFFCKTNIALKEMREAQDTILEERKTNFVLTSFVITSSKIKDEKHKEVMKHIEECGYKEVDRREFYHEKENHICILYTRKEKPVSQRCSR